MTKPMNDATTITYLDSLLALANAMPEGPYSVQSTDAADSAYFAALDPDVVRALVAVVKTSMAVAFAEPGSTAELGAEIQARTAWQNLRTLAESRMGGAG